MLRCCGFGGKRTEKLVVPDPGLDIFFRGLAGRGVPDQERLSPLHLKGATCSSQLCNDFSGMHHPFQVLAGCSPKHPSGDQFLLAASGPRLSVVNLTDGTIASSWQSGNTRPIAVCRRVEREIC
jgi:hypothetical protein